ncbi:MAG: D-Ala-D-Ala carboxypeptidase family metallohydrolase [Gammaproteobacteria bacterium]|nr:D-Ala-D-Ala carboxypeptidase family metallohydrolase [Gammaproteobacteria bacterium]
MRANHYAEVDHYVYYCGPSYCYGGGYAGTTRKSLESTAESERVCGIPEVDKLVREYDDTSLYTRKDFKPVCESFKSGGGSKHFTWSELNGHFTDGNPHRPWGIVTDILRRGVDHIASTYAQFKGIRMTSGYRCPHGNAQVGGKIDSSHMIGRAADLNRRGWTKDEYEEVKRIAQRAGGFALPYGSYSDGHMHITF